MFSFLPLNYVLLVNVNILLIMFAIIDNMILIIHVYVTATDKETIEMIKKPVNPLFRLNLRYKRWLP